jgi:hypothetical protein
MSTSGEGIAAVEREMLDVVSARLAAHRFEPISAADVHATKDYLEKIIQTVRGCGFGVAVFSRFTPADTMGNIFFEVGQCNLFGKPVVLVKTDDTKVPSDFVRTEWVTYDGANDSKLSAELDKAFTEMNELSDYYETLGNLAFEAREFDAELAFERYRQAFLINGSSRLQRKITAIGERLADAAPSRSAYRRLERSIHEFVAMST